MAKHAPITSRRAVLGGLAAVPLVGGGAAIASTACPAETEIQAMWPEIEAAKRGFDAAVERYGAAELEVKAGRGDNRELERADELSAAASERLAEFADRLCELRCTTLAGLQLKARFSALDGEGAGHTPVAESIVEDLLAMCGAAAAPNPSPAVGASQRARHHLRELAEAVGDLFPDWRVRAFHNCLDVHAIRVLDLEYATPTVIVSVVERKT